mgnify:FL=1
MKNICEICLREVKGKKYSCFKTIDYHLDTHECCLSCLCKDCWVKHEEAHNSQNAICEIEMGIKSRKPYGNKTFF